MSPQAQAESAVAGADPVIARNLGAGGARDFHLEDFSVSNGGPNLIEDASIMLAFGRRYGLVCNKMKNRISHQHDGHFFGKDKSRVWQTAA